MTISKNELFGPIWLLVLDRNACNLKTMLVVNTYRLIGIMVRVFANGPGDRGSIPGRFIPKTQKNGTLCILD